jgi:hypothetical protein
MAIMATLYSLPTFPLTKFLSSYGRLRYVTSISEENAHKVLVTKDEMRNFGRRLTRNFVRVVTSGFRCDVGEIWALLGCYAA